MEIAAEHRKKKDRNGTQAEYLSGFYRDDRLVSVITLVIILVQKNGMVQRV